MSKLAVIIQGWDEEKKEWSWNAETIDTFDADDIALAIAEAKDLAIDLLNGVLVSYEESEGSPVRTRILICPILDDNSLEIGAKVFCVSIGVE